MLCTRRTKTLVSTCVILSGMTNIVCLLYVGWITNYVANGGPKVAESGEAERKLEEDSKGETLRIIERLDRLESVVNEHIKGEQRARHLLAAPAAPQPPDTASPIYLRPKGAFYYAGLMPTTHCDSTIHFRGMLTRYHGLCWFIIVILQ